MTSDIRKRILISRHDDKSQKYEAVDCRVHGNAHGSFGDLGGLWAVRGTLEQGSQLHWDERHGDQVLFLVCGRAHINGQEIPVDGAVFIEAGTAAVLTALALSEVVHFGSVSPEAADSSGTLLKTEKPGIHIVSRDEADGAMITSPEGVTYNTQYYQDGTCETCSAVLLRVETSESVDVAPHSHSVDEIIHVLRGEIRIGSRLVGPGMSLGVPGNMRYAFKTPGPVEFINYRADLSYYVDDTHKIPIKETLATAMAEF